MFGFGLQSIRANRYDMIVLGISISFERKTMLVAEQFIQKIGYRIWQTSCPYLRWRYLVSTSL